MEKFCDAVFEGGGMRGIGLVGAVAIFEQQGYKFRNVAGSSAGAIVASLLAAGYTAEEMRQEMESVKFEKFKERSFLKGLGGIGSILGAATHFGLYSATRFETWIEELLLKKGVVTFDDVKGKLQITASDITAGKGLVLPQDLESFGIESGTFKVATAVRMSMGIPVFYEPFELMDKDGATHYIVDGAVLSNYPIWILDDGRRKLDVPVFGFRFSKRNGPISTKKPNLISYVKQIVSTVVDASDDEYQIIMRGDPQRTIQIDTLVNGEPVGITDFHMPFETIEAMYKNGMDAGEQFLKTWNFKAWTRDHRSNTDGLLYRVMRRRRT